MFNYYSNNIQCIRFLINSYTFLLHSIDLLVQHNIVHNNISTTSIGINNNNEPIIFHFGLSMILTPSNLCIEYLSKYFMSYDSTYYYRPFELHVFSYLLSNNMVTLSVFHIDKIVEETITNNKFIIKFGKNIKTIFEREGKEYLNKMVNKPMEYILSNIFQYNGTWDNFRLSILYLQLITDNFHLSDQFIQNIVKVLLVNIHSNPNKRFTIQKTLDLLENICYNTKCMDYKKIRLLSK